MCGDELSDEQRETLKANVTGLVEFGAMPDVKHIYKIDNWDIVKNMTEMLCCGRFFKHMQDNDLFSEVERVFKVSGRYTLNSDFQLSNFPPNGFIFAQKRTSQFSVSVTGNDPNDNFQYMSRLWTFWSETVLLHSELNGYSNMLVEMVTRCNEGGYLDIEHLLYRTFKDEKTGETTEREKMGIEVRGKYRS